MNDIDEDKKERARAMHREWIANNKEKVSAYRKKYYAEHKEAEKKYQKEYCYNHLEEVRSYGKEYRKKHQDQEASRHRKFREEHYDDEMKRLRKYHKDNPEKNREHARRRRALIVSSPGRGITPEQEQQIFKDYNYRCAYCGRGDIKLEVDHIVPLSKGGINDIENATSSCRPCNVSKNNKSLLRFLYNRQRRLDEAEIINYNLSNIDDE